MVDTFESEARSHRRENSRSNQELMNVFQAVKEIRSLAINIELESEA